ncbi:MAG: hypothetical protein ABIH69_00240 [bacterium]
MGEIARILSFINRAKAKHETLLSMKDVAKRRLGPNSQESQELIAAITDGHSRKTLGPVRMAALHLLEIKKVEIEAKSAQTDLEEQVKNLEGQVAILTKQNAQLQTELEGLTQQAQGLTARIDTLKEISAAMGATNPHGDDVTVGPPAYTNVVNKPPVAGMTSFKARVFYRIFYPAISARVRKLEIALRNSKANAEAARLARKSILMLAAHRRMNTAPGKRSAVMDRLDNWAALHCLQSIKQNPLYHTLQDDSLEARAVNLLFQVIPKIYTKTNAMCSLAITYLVSVGKKTGEIEHFKDALDVIEAGNFLYDGSDQNLLAGKYLHGDKDDVLLEVFSGLVAAAKKGGNPAPFIDLALDIVEERIHYPANVTKALLAITSGLKGDAEAQLKRVADIAETRLRNELDDRIKVHVRMARVVAGKNKAEKAYLAAEEILKRTKLEPSFELQIERITTLLALRKEDEAQALRKSLPPAPIVIIEVLISFAQYYEKEERHDEAVKHLELAAKPEMIDNIPPPRGAKGHFQTRRIEALCKIARLFGEFKEKEKALALMRRAEQLGELSMFRSNQVKLVKDINMTATNLDAMGEPARAEFIFAENLWFYLDGGWRLPVNPIKTPIMLKSFAAAFASLKDTKLAINLFEQLVKTALEVLPRETGEDYNYNNYYSMAPSLIRFCVANDCLNNSSFEPIISQFVDMLKSKSIDLGSMSALLASLIAFKNPQEEFALSPEDMIKMFRLLSLQQFIAVINHCLTNDNAKESLKRAANHSAESFIYPSKTTDFVTFLLRQKLLPTEKYRAESGPLPPCKLLEGQAINKQTSDLFFFNFSKIFNLTTNTTAKIFDLEFEKEIDRIHLKQFNLTAFLKATGRSAEAQLFTNLNFKNSQGINIITEQS